MEIILWKCPGLVLPHVSNIVQKLIFYFNFVIWLLPPFRQYKGGFFLYFLIFALTDTIGYLIFFIFQIPPFYFYAFFSLLMLFASLHYTHSLKPWVILFNTFIFLIGVVLFLIFKDVRILILLTAYLHLIILFNFIIYSVQKLFLRNILYSYFLLLIFYEFTLIAKSVMYVYNVRTSIPLIYLLNVLEVLICIYFVTFNLKTGYRFHPKRNILTSK